MKNSCESCFRKSLAERAVSVSNKLLALESQYRIYSGSSACSDTNVLYHKKLEFYHAQDFLDFAEDLERLLVVIFEGKDDFKD